MSHESPDSKPDFDRLIELLNQLHNEGALPATESEALEALLVSDKAAREYYIHSQQLHAMLEVDNSVRLQLASDLLPENVVPLPGIDDLEPAAEPALRDDSLVIKNKVDGVGLKVVFRLATSFAAMIAGVVGLFWMYSKVADLPGENKVARVNHRVSFEKEVLPILEANCFGCHGEDDDTREADLRLDLAEVVNKHSVIIPGRSADSEMIARISSSDDTYRMPPPDSGKPLTSREVAILTDWVDQGAHYKDHPELSARLTGEAKVHQLAQWLGE